MNTQSIILNFLALILLVLAGWVLKTYQRSHTSWYFAGSLLGFGLLAALYAALLQTEDPDVLLLITRFGYIAGVFTFSMLLQFSFYYPIPSRPIPSSPILYWALPLAFFAPLFFFGDQAIKAATVVSGGIREIYGPVFFLLPIFVGVYVIWTLVNLFRKLGHIHGQEQRNTRLFIWALVISVLAGLIFDILFPAFGKPRMPIAIYSSSILFGLAAYIISKK